MGYVKWMDENPKWLKVILSLFLGFFWTLYRILKSAKDKNMLGVILGIILLFVGAPFMWLVDLITLLFMNKVLWF